jgi:hypothetical protein
VWEHPARHNAQRLCGFYPRQLSIPEGCRHEGQPLLSSGAIILQGPHHSAKKSTNTGVSSLIISEACHSYNILTLKAVQSINLHFGFTEQVLNPNIA